MKQHIDRRTFVKLGLLAGTSAAVNLDFLPGVTSLSAGTLETSGEADIISVHGGNFFQDTESAVEQLGGMGKFVSRGSKVGLLLNSPFKNYGASVKPEIALAAIKMIYEAGAKEIHLLKEGFSGYWERSKLYAEYSDEIASLEEGWDDFIDYSIPGYVSLEDPSITKPLLDLDGYINISIIKHHDGVKYTCTMKNMMGTCSTMTNMGMHVGGKLGLSFFPDVEYLSQCVVDLNTVRAPDLCIVDATEFITEKGPYGPGKLAKPHRVVAGTDRVALDTYCARFLNVDATRLPMVKFAEERGLGVSDLSKIVIKEISL